jgi:hypothetical protein
MTGAADWPLADGESLMREWMDGVGERGKVTPRERPLSREIDSRLSSGPYFLVVFLGIFES